MGRSQSTTADSTALVAQGSKEEGQLPAVNPQRGLTPREVAQLCRVSPERVRGWIVRGELGAINTADVRCCKPRFVVLPEHMREFALRRKVVPETKPQWRRRLPTGLVDYLS
jgi:hypothetical protein